MSVPITSPPPSPCVFCRIAARSSTSAANLLYSDEKVVAFEDINPSAFRHYLVIPVEHIPTVRDLTRRAEDYNLVIHMLNVGQALLQRDAPQSKLHRNLSIGNPAHLGLAKSGAGFGFHQPPLNSVNHLHLHCLALPFIPKWKQLKYMPLGQFVGFIEAEKLLNRIKPE